MVVFVCSWILEDEQKEDLKHEFFLVIDPKSKRSKHFGSICLPPIFPVMDSIRSSAVPGGSRQLVDHALGALPSFDPAGAGVC